MDMIHHLFSRLGELAEFAITEAGASISSQRMISVLDRSALDDSLDAANNSPHVNAADEEVAADASDLESSRTNARGVRFTQKQEISDSALVRVVFTGRGCAL